MPAENSENSSIAVAPACTDTWVPKSREPYPHNPNADLSWILLQQKVDACTADLQDHRRGSKMLPKPVMQAIKNPERPARVLLVEDNKADVRLITEAFREAKIAHELEFARDGVEAMKRLKDGAAADLPDVVLLDLNLPKKNGQTVLAEMKADAVLKRIPVIVLTSSNAVNDVRAVYELNANCFVRKPLAFDEYVNVVRSIERFWLNTAVLPVAA